MSTHFCGKLGRAVCSITLTAGVLCVAGVLLGGCKDAETAKPQASSASAHAIVHE
jgi:hypothetical protein